MKDLNGRMTDLAKCLLDSPAGGQSGGGRGGKVRERRHSWRGVVLACALAVLGCTDKSETAVEVSTQQSPGAVLYLTYCQSCHGVQGTGNGPAASSLRTPPANLTQLWTRYGTPLDRERIAEYIDGRRLISLHGLREMPIWGDEFFEDSPPMSPGLERAKKRLIDVLIEHLQMLQRQQQT